MPVEHIALGATGLDLSSRVVDTTTVAASPSGATETVIATLVIPQFASLAVQQKIYLQGWAAFTVGTSGASVRLRIRQTSVSGSTVADTGALTGGVSAGNLLAQDVMGSDATPGVGTYVLTLTVASGAAASTVSALQLLALVV